MLASDLTDVLALEMAVFPDPWTRGMFEDELSAPGALSLVARDRAGAWPVSGFTCIRVLAGEMHLLKLAVRPSFQRNGVGTAILCAGESLARAGGAAEAFLEVRASNRAGRSFYTRAGYETVGTRRAYYRDSGEDALVMRKLLTLELF
ncbi:MAG: ribosomal protein S18-alanine N-acetyltransferase [Thermodesulfobacteriota bacterium]